ncbi:MAG: hypothetical protein IIB95_12215 [Candidatus Marinimicrobia bacterium]|nr:hypothetical protein [Candidatus Neomarinimicrobiota bacterium]MCH7764481.1 hypothetical protein [Candidatus Neomarinimicrobiota bacterium]
MTKYQTCLHPPALRFHAFGRQAADRRGMPACPQPTGGLAGSDEACLSQIGDLLGFVKGRRSMMSLRFPLVGDYFSTCRWIAKKEMDFIFQSTNMRNIFFGLK